MMTATATLSRRGGVVLDFAKVGGGKVRHYALDTHTLCGWYTDEYTKVTVLPRTSRTFHIPVCKRCMAVRGRMMADHDDIDTVLPAMPTTPTRDGATRGNGAGVRFTEVSARVFRVQGKTDTYTVTIPLDPYLATLCTCMAGKVNPDVACKHQVAVLEALVDAGEVIG